jgi:hypothetical protein
MNDAAATQSVAHEAQRQRGKNGRFVVLFQIDELIHLRQGT